MARPVSFTLISPALPTLRSHTGPKLLLASSLDRTDLESAQQFVQTCWGPTILSTLPVPETGCRLLASAWADHVVEQILPSCGVTRDLTSVASERGAIDNRLR